MRTALRILLGVAGVLWGIGTAGCASTGGNPPPRPNRILNLYDSFGKEVPGTTMDWGFSCLVDYNGRRILFDSGTNADVFANAGDKEARRRIVRYCLRPP